MNQRKKYKLWLIILAGLVVNGIPVIAIPGYVINCVGNNLGLSPAILANVPTTI
jgi:beta-lactamase regulating signal transducer with metallopeptidase domain